MLKWIQFVKVGETGLIRKQGKQVIKAAEQAVEDNAVGIHTTREVLHQILHPQACEAALRRDIRWLMENVRSQRQKGLWYPLEVLKAH